MPSSPALLAASAVAQLVLIAALVAQWRRSRSLDVLVRQRAGMDERTGALVHELNQPLTAILSNAQAAQRFLASDRLDLRELREILADIVTDDKRAAGLIKSLGGMLQETKVSGASNSGKGQDKRPGARREEPVQ